MPEKISGDECRDAESNAGQDRYTQKKPVNQAVCGFRLSSVPIPAREKRMG
jgi:hypothetical protein